MQKDAAETLALRALAHIAADPVLLGRLAEESGLGQDELMQHAGQPGFLGGVLDFLLADEGLLLAFCAEAEVAPSLPARARQYLPGSPVEWP